MNIKEILIEVSCVGSKNKKIDILKSHKSNDVLKSVFRLAYDKSIVYGIKKIPERKVFRGVVNFSDALIELEEMFATRKITGDAATNRLQEIMGMMSDDDSEVIRRIILRDLECGASASTANKVWGGLIKETPCMKASACSVKTLAKIKYPAIAQLKADGTRCMIIKHNGIVSAWSRNGKEFIGITPIIKLFEDYEADNFVLD
ncbi:MAG: hypothetical protein ACRC68_08180, partial [Clostridium sp.]